ncbi:putative inorganic phosphate cotransporter [Homalodisca vitripennis]|uniref:putative inorganic phosphate cotransporter n=1 Tax=Homalodisca vitripennis TaxID=197043 RepID=UPI001EEBD1DF|nr:putative inorganic phosphate cotransporter [Homalodisca vitripennis]
MKEATQPILLVQRPPGFGVRHLQAIMTFFCMFLCYALRLNLSVAIVSMTDKTSRSGIPVLPWDSAKKGLILSSLFWGYVVPQIPMGEVARKYGSKYPLFAATLFCSIMTILSPYIALNFSWVVFCLNRLLQGFAQGVFFPCVNAHTAQWAPSPEKYRIFTFVFVGTQFGTMITMFVAGYLAASPWGWPSIFYCTGLCGVLWSVVWLFVGADSPDSHPSISDHERKYIKSTLINNSDNCSSMSTPWKAVATSVPVWALMFCHLCNNWGYWTIATMLPSYVSKVLHFDIQSNGMISSMPFLTKCVLSGVFGVIGDAILEKQLLSLNVAKKLWNTIALWGGAAAFVGLGFTSDSTTAVVMLIIIVGIGAAIYTGFFSNHLDLAPNFAGLLMGITNCFANFPAIFAPMVAGFIVEDQENRDQWMILFYISAAFFFMGNLVFILFGTTNVQPWNNIKPAKKGSYSKDNELNT